jgi:hypothetical protein
MQTYRFSKNWDLARDARCHQLSSIYIYIYIAREREFFFVGGGLEAGSISAQVPVLEI